MRKFQHHRRLLVFTLHGFKGPTFQAHNLKNLTMHKTKTTGLPDLDNLGTEAI